MFDPSILKIIIAVVMILLDLAVVGIGFVYILFGFIFGTRKSLRRALSFLIPFVIFTLSLNLITNLVMNATIYAVEGETLVATETILEFGTRFLTEQLSTLLYNGNVTAAQSSKIITLATSLATSLIRNTLYFIGLFVIAILVAPITRFIAWMTYRVQIKGKPKQKLSWASRVGGMGIASIRFVIFILIVGIPFSGVISTTKMIVEDASFAIGAINENEERVDNEIDFVQSIIENVNEGMEFSLTRQLSKITRGDDNKSSLDMRYLGSFFELNTEDGDLNILEEYGKIHSVLPTAGKILDVVNNNNDITYEDIIDVLDSEDVNVISDFLKESDIINIVLPVGYDYACFYLDDQGILEQNNITVEMVRSIDVNKDFDKIINAAAIAIEIIISEDISFETEEELVEAIITNDAIATNLQTFIDDILTTDTAQNIALPLASSYIVEAIESSENETLKDIIPLLTAEKLNLYLEKDISSVFDMAYKIYKTPLKEYINCLIRGEDPSAIYIDLSDPSITSTVEYTITTLMKLNIVHGNENTIVKLIVSSLLDEGYNIDEILFDENGNSRIDWANETNIVAHTVVVLLETFGKDVLINIDNPEQLLITLLESNNSEVIIEEIIKSGLIKDLITTFVTDFVQENEDLPAELKDLLTKENLENCFEADIKQIVIVLQKLYNTNLKTFINEAITNKEFDIEKLDLGDDDVISSVEQLLSCILNLSIINGNEELLFEYVFTLINDSNEGINIDAKEILYDEQGNKKIDWEKEKNIVVSTVVIALNIFGNTLIDDTKNPEQLIITYLENNVYGEELVNQIVHSEFIKTVLTSLIVDVLDSNEDIPVELKTILTKENIEKCFEEDIIKLVKDCFNLYHSDLKDIINEAITNKELDFEELDLSNEDIIWGFKVVINTVLNLTIINGNEEVLFEYVIGLINDSNEGINIDAKEILYDENGNIYIDWDNEKTCLINAVEALFKNFGTELKQVSEKPTDLVIALFAKEESNIIIDSILDSELINSLVTNIVCELIHNNETLPDALKDVLTKETLKTCLKEDLKVLISDIRNIYNSEYQELLINLIEGKQVEVKDIDFSSDVLQKDFKALIINLLNTSIIKGNEEALLEYVIELLNDSNKDFNIDAKELLYDEEGNKVFNFENEKHAIVDAVFGVLEILNGSFGDNLQVEEYIDLFILNALTSDVIDNIVESELLGKFISTIATQAISNNNDLPTELKEILTEEAVETLFKEDIKDLYNILVELYNSSLKDDIMSAIFKGNTFAPDLEDESNQTVFKNTIVDLLNLSIITGNEEKLITMLIGNIEGFEIDLESILFDDQGQPYIDWEFEASALCDALFILVNTLGTDFNNFTFEMFEENLLSDKEKTKEFVDTVSESEIFRTVILEMLPDIIQETDTIPQEILNFFSKEKFEKLEEKEAFKKEINLLLEVLVDLIDLGLTDIESFEITSENQVLLKDALTKAIESSFIKGEEETLFKFIFDTTNFTSMLQENGITLDYSVVTDWHNELVVSIDVALAFVDIATGVEFALGDLFSGNMSEEEIDNVANLFDNIGKSELFKPIIYQLIDNIGYDINITEEDKALIEVKGFGNEIRTLLQVIGEAQALLESEDLTSLKGSDVEVLMTDASNGIITSKVVGTLLATALGPDGLNINPLDEHGNPKYDFTDPTTLKTQAKNIANLIDLANSMSSFDINNATSVTDITEALKGLENNELAEDTLKEITGIEVNLDDLNIEEEATLIENVYQEYTNSADPDNYVPSEEMLEQLEQSNLAETILGILGVISK